MIGETGRGNGIGELGCCRSGAGSELRLSSTAVVQLDGDAGERLLAFLGV